MLTAIILIIFLSVSGCKDHPSLPPRPDGKSCVHVEGEFGCNEINNPEAPQVIYNFQSPEMHKAICMPLETKEKYDAYIVRIKEIATERCY